MSNIHVLFHQVPPGTHFQKGCYSLVDEGLAGRYIQEGYGEAYDPVKKQAIRPDPSLPDDLPGREHFINSGITTMDQVREVSDYDLIEGIGQATEKKIIEYLDGD